jgi:hypothetical protein
MQLCCNQAISTKWITYWLPRPCLHLPWPTVVVVAGDAPSTLTKDGKREHWRSSVPIDGSMQQEVAEQRLPWPASMVRGGATTAMVDVDGRRRSSAHGGGAESPVVRPPCSLPLPHRVLLNLDHWFQAENRDSGWELSSRWRRFEKWGTMLLVLAV